MSTEIMTLGQILEWPNGYAMSLGVKRWDINSSVVRCCAGHPTPDEAKSHGLARLIEVAAKVADRDIAAWERQAAS